MTGSSVAPNAAAIGVWAALCRFVPLLDAFGVDVQRSGGGLGRAALLGQAQGFGAEGRIILTAFVGVWRVFRDEGKTPP